jgi:hypothetical protein
VGLVEDCEANVGARRGSPLGEGWQRVVRREDEPPLAGMPSKEGGDLVRVAGVCLCATDVSAQSLPTASTATRPFPMAGEKER